MSNSAQFDQHHIWHPYTSMTDPLPTKMVESAEGVRLKLTDGQELIDGMASWWCVIHGYNHPRLNQAAKSQIDTVSHVMFGGLTHRPAIDLCQRLIEITPSTLEHVFLADSGSISVEVAMKMAVQYWHTQHQSKKCKMLSLRGGYHGDTFAAMSVCDPDTGMHHLFSDSVTQQHFADRPTIPFDGQFNTDSLTNFESQLKQNQHEIAAVIIEPIVQGAGGMWFYHPSYLTHIRQLCDEYDVLLIADEIATGFGRTGKMFACEWANIKPDIMCLGKALTGGYLSLAATLSSTKVAHGISSNGGVFMHGPTFMGNPLACAIANESLNVLLTSNWKAKIDNIQAQLTAGLASAATLPNVADVRVLGAIGVIEMRKAVDTKLAQEFFVERGVWIRPFGKLVYVMPPYVIDNHDLATLCDAMVAFAGL